MSSSNFNKIVAVALFASVILFVFACQSNSSNKSANSSTTANGSTPAPNSKPPTMTDYPVGNAQTPSEAYRMLFAAVKSQDSAKIRSMLSKGSLGLAEMAAGQQKKTVDEVVRNGFTETTFSDTMPELRDERIKAGNGAVEVWNTTRKAWEDIPFTFEDGSWKAAFGDAFGGKWQSPGKGQAVIEQEEANARNPQNNLIPYGNGNINGNTQFKTGKRVKKVE